MSSHFAGLFASLPRRGQLLALVAALAGVALVPGVRGRWLREIAESENPTTAHAVPDSGIIALPELVHLDAGLLLPPGQPPTGWSHQVLETIPRLASGDLDTVSAQAHEIAGRIHPLIVADVKPSPARNGHRFALSRLGVGLCAPGTETDSRVVVSATMVDGTAGTWSTKQRLILTAMSMESARASLDFCTPTFALLRTPVTFLVGGAHEKIDVLYAIMVNPGTGSLDTVVWTELDGRKDAAPARRISLNLFDSPMHIKASKLLGRLPVAWSFAVTELPPGDDLQIPVSLQERLKQAVDQPAQAAEVEQEFRQILHNVGV